MMQSGKAEPVSGGEGEPTPAWFRAVFPVVVVLLWLSVAGLAVPISRSLFFGTCQTVDDLVRDGSHCPSGLIFQRVKDSALRYALTPGAEKTYEKIHYRINGDGFRGGEYSVNKPDGVKRILMIGDSFTFGWNIPQPDTIPAQLQEKLVVDGRRWEVLNFGVPGYQSKDEETFFLQKGLKYSPDIVVVLYFMNDTMSSVEVPGLKTLEPMAVLNRVFALVDGRLSPDEERETRAFLGTQGSAADLIAHARLISDQLRGTPWATEFPQEMLSYYFPVYWNTVASFFATLREEGQRRGFRTLVAVLPHFVDSWGPNYWQHAEAMLFDEANKDGLEFLPLRPILEHFPVKQLRLPNDGHTNAFANSVIAGAICSYLEAKGML